MSKKSSIEKISVGLVVLGALLAWLPSSVQAQQRPLLEHAYTIPLVTLQGIRLWHRFAGAGDVNGDGYDDLLFSAEDVAHQGRAALYLGRAASMPSTLDWLVAGDANATEKFGMYVAAAGDVNGDGYDDVLVGDPGVEVEQPHPYLPPPFVMHYASGRAYLYLGGPTGLATTPAWSVTQPESHFGSALSAAGDVDGDGYDDVLVGTPGFHNDTNLTASRCIQDAVYLYRGTATGLEAQPVWQQRPQPEYACYGSALAGRADFNHDGYDDVAIGAFGYDNGPSGLGQVFVYYGSAMGLSTQAAPSLEEPGVITSAASGYDIVSAGDVDGDGFDDLLVKSAAYFQEAAEWQYFLYRGSPSGLMTQPFWRASGFPHPSFIGVLGGHDINGDGLDDVFIGSWKGSRSDSDILMYQGQDASVFGRAPAWQSLPQAQGGGFDRAAFPGDFNGDGHADLVATGPGGFHFFFGGPNPAPVADAQSVSVLEGMSVLITLSASDLHEDALRFELVDYPAHGQLDTQQLALGLLTYTPEPGFVGADRFTFGVSDPYGGQGQAEVSIQVTARNQPPQFLLPASTSWQAEVGQRFEMTLQATDPEGEALSYQVEPLLEGASLEAARGLFALTPTASQRGSHALIFTVSDPSGEQDTLAVALEVVARDEDGDGVPDEEDACPDEPGSPERAGCPPPEPADMGLAQDMAVLDMGEVQDMDPTSAPDLGQEDLGMEADLGAPREPVEREGCGGCATGASAPARPLALLWGALLLAMRGRLRGSRRGKRRAMAGDDDAP